MPLSFRLKSNTVPPGICLSTMQGVVDTAAKYMEVIGPEGLGQLIISATEPITDDRDKLWVQLNETTLTPVGSFIYTDSEWLLVPGVPIGVIFGYSGDISNIPAGWFLADGTNGATDLTNNTDFASWWEPNYSAPETVYTLCPIQHLGYDA